MESRREFLKKAALLTGATAMWGVFPESIQRALAINPETGSTFLDAEHIVILMQENRSFDHTYGTLQGVRGYGDPRAHVLPNHNPVWCQSNAAGETYAPFRLNIKETNVTWTGSLPHSWGDQVDAMNKGRYDRWLQVKGSGNHSVAKLPMTLGHYTREDIPFYYSLADAFTICDQNFCSSLTGTTPNRLYLWTGTIRDQTGKARVYNEETDYGAEANWKTFPERLQDHGISWKVYQNEISLDTGLTREEDAWLSNFTDNPLEWFSQFNVQCAPIRQVYLVGPSLQLPLEIDHIQQQLKRADMSAEERAKLAKSLDEKKLQLSEIEKTREELSKTWNGLTTQQRELHKRAFCTNGGDENYRNLTSLVYGDDGTQRTVEVPAGDVLHQFRADVVDGDLPTVSWLVAPENFSDHPSSAWYGAWYVSEVLDILTRNPEVWKKTIFILAYDENDGYFDHVVPFAAPNPADPTSGKVTEGIDAAAEYITAEEDKKSRPKHKPRDNSIGLGFRVPLVVASPWSRGGCVCSEVFDHTSILQFLEVFLSHKTKKKIEESNISSWRRAVCGDLTSVFQPYKGEPVPTPTSLKRDSVIRDIHSAQFKKAPGEIAPLTPADIAEIAKSGLSIQEPGTRPSAPLPYHLFADARVANKRFELHLRATKSGAPFNVYSYSPSGYLKMRAYAVEAGKRLSDAWDIEDDPYHIRVDGPNGFMREFKGSAPDVPGLAVTITYAKSAVQISLTNQTPSQLEVRLQPHAYSHLAATHMLKPGASQKLVIDTTNSQGWYDFSILSGDSEHRCAGRLETGAWSTTDPAMATQAE